jgi:hypothetical protein
MTESTKARTAGPPIPESQNPDRDYPQMVSQRGLIEPAPRRVRGYFDGTLVFERPARTTFGRSPTTRVLDTGPGAAPDAA